MTIKRIIAYFMIMIMVIPNTVIHAEEKFKAYVVDDFEFKDSSGNWWIQNTDSAVLSLSSQYAHSGARSLKYSYNKDTFEIGIISKEWSKGGMLVKNSSKYKYMGFWVYGDGKEASVGVDLRTGDGANVRFGFTAVNFEGWRYIEYKLGDNITPDIRVYEFLVKKSSSEYGNTGELYFDDLTFSENSYYATEGAGSEIAGMFGGDESGSSGEGAATLQEVTVPAVKRTSPQTAQIGNENPLQMLKYKESKDLPDNISGVATGDNGTVRTIAPGTRGVAWAAGWLNDGETLADQTNTVYSSGMHASSSATEWVMLTFPENETINKINILPRKRSWCYPTAYTLEVSVDGENWTTVAEEKNFKYEDPDNAPVTYEFDPVTCKYLKLNATRLTHDGNKSTYYLQIREIEAYNESGENVALYTHGTTAEGGNPLSSNQVLDYDQYFSNIFDSGAKWINIINLEFWGNGNVSEIEKENMRHLSENGVNITYRFLHGIGNISEEDAKALGDEFAKQVEPYVTALKDYVDVWQISNEENFHGDPGGSKSRETAYAIVVGKVADRIRQLDPGCKIEIETALIDFDWTKNIMENGLAGKIDIMGIHVYKETYGPDNMIEANGTFIHNGTRYFPKDHKYKDYRDEIDNYRKLIQQYNPNCEIWCTETSINRGANPYCVTELVQAKYLAREYIYHQMLNVGPTCWWTLDFIKTNDIEWGLMSAAGERLDSWYALRNVANVMNNGYQIAEEMQAEFSQPDNMIYECFKNGDTYQIPYWVMAKMRSANTGRATDITISGIDVKNAVCIDMITGTVQALNFEKDGDKTIFKDMIARDYPMVIRINSDETYDVYNADTPGTVQEKQLWEKIASSAVLLQTNSDFGIVRGNKKDLSDTAEGAQTFVLNDISYVPARFLAEALGKHIYWLDGLIVISNSELEIDEDTANKLKEYYQTKEE